MEIVERLQREAPDAPEILYLMGIAYTTMEEYGRALAMIEEAHRLDPDCFEYAEVLANLHVRVGQLNEGLYFAKLSTTLEPHPHVFNLVPSDLSNFFESLEQVAIPRHYAIGFVRLEQHEYEEAAREFDRNIMLSPDDGPSHQRAATANLVLGEYERAIAHMQKAIHLQPDDPECHFQAGQISKRIGATDAAMYHFKKVAELAPDSLKFVAAASSTAHQMVHADDGSLSELDKALETAIAAAPGLPEEAAPSSVRKEKIHVGYFTNHGWNHDTAALLQPFLTHHDRKKFEVVLYQQARGPSAYIQQLEYGVSD